MLHSPILSLSKYVRFFFLGKGFENGSMIEFIFFYFLFWHYTIFSFRLILLFFLVSC
jgi:hypothetical protein